MTVLLMTSLVHTLVLDYPNQNLFGQKLNETLNTSLGSNKLRLLWYNNNSLKQSFSVLAEQGSFKTGVLAHFILHHVYRLQHFSSSIQ